MKYTFQTQGNHEFVNPETCGKFPSLADPDAEVYTVAQLIARHEKGLLTNMNIGKDTAYPAFASHRDLDLEKAMKMDPTDKFHLANEMESDPDYLDALKRKKEADEKAQAEAAEAAFQAEAAKRGFVRKEESEGGTKVVPS